MPVLHAIDEQRDLVLTVFRDEVSDDDVRAHLAALRAHPHFHRLMRELVDLRGVTTVSVSSTLLIESARWLLHDPKARRALVAPTDLLYGLSRMYQTNLGEVGASQLGVFREMAPALRWIGLSSEDELPAPITPTSPQGEGARRFIRENG